MTTRVWQRLGRVLRARVPSTPRTPTPRPRPAPEPPSGPASAPDVLAAAARTAYPGDFTGSPPWEYAPESDGLADPGEVVWAWVPYEDDHSRGKDRPALVVGRDGTWLLAMPLTSKDHDRDAAAQARHGRIWYDIGTGGWDSAGRSSEVRLDRVLRLDPDAIRREGGRLDERRFEEVAALLRTMHGWA